MVVSLRAMSVVRATGISQLPEARKRRGQGYEIPTSPQQKHLNRIKWKYNNPSKRIITSSQSH